MDLVFERGERSRPVGHALLYFRTNDGTILATYVTVPPIKFDLSGFLPGMFSQMLQGMDLSMGSEMMAAPVPPVPELVAGIEYLQALAARRSDDLVFAGGVVQGDPMRLMAETQEAARSYGEMYAATTDLDGTPGDIPGQTPDDTARFADMTDQERLGELTRLTGRARDALRFGQVDADLEREIRVLAASLPAKYRPESLVRAALTPGEQGQKLAQLYLERSYRLFNEDYLDLARVDREIAELEA